MSAAEMIPYEGDEALRDDVLHAIGTVVDPEMGLSVVDVGLVYGVRVEPSRVHVEITMTSAACPVAELIAEEIRIAVGGALNAATLAAFVIVMVYAIYRGARPTRRAHPAPVVQN